MKIMEADMELIDKDKIRRIMAKHINTALDNLEPTDILINFEEDTYVQNAVKKLGGDVLSNPKITKFEDDALKLIKMSIRNCKAHINQFVPLWIIAYAKDDGGVKQ